MTPDRLDVRSFRRYPPEAKQLAETHVEILRALPIGFIPLLLRELIAYDWKFPVERGTIDRQISFLSSLPPERLQQTMAPFAALQIAKSLTKVDWVNDPTGFSERLSAHLWETGQIDGFRDAAMKYVNESGGSAPPDAPTPHRLGIAVIGSGVKENAYRLFRKLRPHGVYFNRVADEGGLDSLKAIVAKRAADYPAPYAHWCIDGDAIDAQDGVTCVSYDALAPVRGKLQNWMRKMYEAETFDPEGFRTRMAQMDIEQVGLDDGKDELLDRFRLSLLTEGSGTQVYATTFVQWAAREALRRAQPVTLLTRYSARQRSASMDELMHMDPQATSELDPQGSLIDGDMGAYYTWLNQQRLSGAESSTFLVWFEAHQEAVAIGPSLGRNETSDAPIALADLAQRLA